jgi:hypothetical protein
MYRRVGQTAGYSTCFVRPETVAFAREVALADGFKIPKKDGIRTTWSKDRVLKYALRVCDISRGVLQLNPKGVYVGALDDTHLNHLRNRATQPITCELSVQQATEWWATHEAASVLQSERYACQIRQYSPRQLHLGRQLQLAQQELM